MSPVSMGAFKPGRKSIGTVTVALACTALTGNAAVGQPAEHTPMGGSYSVRQHEGPLDILLTNDDGYSAPTLTKLAGALRDAGHNVTIIAPCTDQSGRGTAEVSNYYTGHGNKAEHTISAYRIAEQKWKVCDTPASAVLFGLQVVFGQHPPDLVVSGVNPGQNIGAVANHSGTVGAAITALEFDVPAIAVSAAYDFSTSPPTLASIAETSRFAVELIDRLQHSRDHGALLPEHVALSVNYPAVENPRGVDITRQGAAAFVTPDFERADALCPSCYLVVPDFTEPPETVRDADTTALANGKISITPLSGYWTAARSMPKSLRSDLRAMARSIE